MGNLSDQQELARQRMAAKLKTIDWDQCSFETMDAVIAMLIKDKLDEYQKGQGSGNP